MITIHIFWIYSIALSSFTFGAMIITLGHMHSKNKIKNLLTVFIVLTIGCVIWPVVWFSLTYHLMKNK